MMTSMNLRRLTLLLFFTFLPFYFFTFTSARSIQTINADRAREVAREQIVWNGRLCTFSTFALDFLRSVYGENQNRYQGLSPEQVVCGWILRPDVWKEEPMIRIPDANLREQLHIKGEYAKFAELFDDTLGYKLNTLGADLPERMRQMARETPAAVGLDEKVGEIILDHPPDERRIVPAPSCRHEAVTRLARRGRDLLEQHPVVGVADPYSSGYRYWP